MILKKVLFLSAWYPTRYDPMAGLFVKRHAEVLTDTFDISVLHAFAVQNLPIHYEIEILTENHIFTIRVFYKKVKTRIPGISHLQKFWRFLKSHYLGYKELQKHHKTPDFVHVNILTRVGIIALFLKLTHGISYVITEHWTRYTSERMEFNGFIRKMLTKLIVTKSDGISVVSKNLKLSMVNYGLRNKHFIIVNNIVDCEYYKPINGVSEHTDKIFSHISCFDDRAKNIFGIIRSIAALTKQRTDFVCLMVGDGPDLAKAVELAGKHGIMNKTIKFTGLLEGKELVEVYNQSLFTLLFSNYENMPVVISESFACGKPVIATKVGGIPEIVNDATGILISPGDEANLTIAINNMLDHHDSYDASLIRDYAIGKFGKDAVHQQLLQLYFPIINT